MNKSKIDWCSHSWNPVTGCLHGCQYCYARKMAHRISGLDGTGPDGLLELSEKRDALYPAGFMPTFHRYRLNEPERATKPRTIFVCSMGELFGEWVPSSWIVGVLDAAKRAPQHRYLFLSKNPARYLELDSMALLPHDKNFWYGSSVTGEESVAAYAMSGADLNLFWSMEPLLGPVDMGASEGLPGWVIIGAETGTRKDKVVPARKWVEDIADFCAAKNIPVFYKANIRTHFPDLPPSEYPWENAE